MPSHDTLERFIALVESNAHDQAIEAFYAPHASMRENQSPPRVGRDQLVAGERQVMARASSISSRCVRPVCTNGDHVVVRWVFRFVWKDDSVTEMEELASRERIVDGPFAEAKEVIGGYWFVRANSLDEAARISAANPCLACGLTYEIRPFEDVRCSAYEMTSETPGGR